MSLIISDLHLGVNRAGGTTMQSQQALRNYGRAQFQRLLDLEDQEVAINGDLFDGFNVDTVELIQTYEILAEWLDNGVRTLHLIRGNHDWSARGDKVSSFQLLCHFLKCRFGRQVRVYESGFECVGADNIHCIPHMPNQDLFNMEIEKALAEDGKGKYLLLHCNYKNGHAENSDHSLNINDDQVGKLMIGGWTLILAHEHQGCDLRGGRVTVVGNQFPTSVADCIGSKGKRAVRIDGEQMTFIDTWVPNGQFAEIDWRTLGEERPLKPFYRVTGEATANEAADVINAISKFRQVCSPSVFVITNAVKVEGAAAFDEMAEVGVEGIKAFDVLGAIFEHLDEAEAAKVKELLA